MERDEAHKWASFYTRHKLAIVWTDGKTDAAAKRVTRQGWPETPPLVGELNHLSGQLAERAKTRNPAVVLRPSGLVGIDCDDEPGLATFTALGLPETFAVQSSEPYKRHYYFTAPVGVEYHCFEFAGGTVTAKRDAYLVFPPALHPSGTHYRPVNGGGITTLPDNCYAQLKEAAAVATREAQARVLSPDEKIEKGTRHSYLISTAGTCRSKGLPLETALAVVQAANTEKCSPPYPAADVEKKVRDIYGRYEGGELPPEAPEWTGDLSELLHGVRKFIIRYIAIGKPEAVALALWIAHTHAFSAAEITPYVEIRSAEKRCGKTTLLRVLQALVRNPRSSANMSDAVLFRLVAQQSPTLLMDEVDAIFGSKARDREDLRGLLNAGFEHGAVAWRMGGNNNTDLHEFPVFSPKAFASIGRLPETITDRSITVRISRKHKGEQVERARRRHVQKEAVPLRTQLASWASSAVAGLANAEPALPDELNDREQDYWEPLLAIADSAGGQWPLKARRAACELSAQSLDDVAPLEELLAGIRHAFEGVNYGHLATVDLISSLCRDDEAPWRGWWWDTHSDTPTKDAPRKLANKLRPLGIKSKQVRTAEAKLRGYSADQFEDAWARYGISGTSGTSGTNGSHKQTDVPDVPDVPDFSGGAATGLENAPMDELRAEYADAQDDDE